jgi:hypothetical protein
MNKILIAGLVGGIVAFLLGWVIWGILMADFFKANVGTATGVEKMPPDMLFLVISNLAWGFLLALIFGRWASISTFQSGAIAGGVICLLIGVSYELGMYSMMNVMTLNGHVVNIILGGIMGAIIGGLVAWVLGYGAKK